jgi:hypothetical protein
VSQPWRRFGRSRALGSAADPGADQFTQCLLLGAGDRIAPKPRMPAPRRPSRRSPRAHAAIRDSVHIALRIFHLLATPHSPTSLAKPCRSAPSPSGDGRECSGTTPAVRPKCRRCDLNGGRCRCCRVRRLRRLRAWQAANEDACWQFMHRGFMITFAASLKRGCRNRRSWFANVET